MDEGTDADSPHHDLTVRSTSWWDEVSFDPDHPSEPTSTFEPTVRRVVAKDWAPPTAVAGSTAGTSAAEASSD